MEKAPRKPGRRAWLVARELAIILASLACGAVLGVTFAAVLKALMAAGLYVETGFDLLRTEIRYEIYKPETTMKEEASFGAVTAFAYYLILRLHRGFNL